MYENILSNIRKLKEEVEKMTGSKNIKIVAVCKNRSIEEIKTVIDSGIIDIAENKVQEAEKKFCYLYKISKKHMIGRLQSNKVKKAVALFDCIQSVSSVELAEKISLECSKIGKYMEIFFQIKEKDDNKNGFLKEELIRSFDYLVKLKNLVPKGVMCIGPLTEDKDYLRRVFRECKEVFDVLKSTYKIDTFSDVSMGMSDDYKIALEEGATMIRIGRAIFE